MDELKASPRNELIGALADMLRAGRETANEYSDLRLGDLFAGRAPEEINEWSYGNLPMHIVGGGTGSLIPQMKVGRDSQVLDVGALAPFLIPPARVSHRGALEALYELLGRR